MTTTNCPKLKISWSRLRTHDECPARGDLRARGFKMPLADSTNFVHGNVVDILERRWLSMDSPELGWMAAQVDAVFDEVVDSTQARGDGVIRWKHPAHRAETLEFCRELVGRLESLLVKFVLPFNWTPAWRFEVPVKIHYGHEIREILLVGEIDLLVFDNQGRVIIWDLKATKNDHYYTKVLGQLAFYALAVKASKAPELGRWPLRAGLLQPMCTERYLPVDIMKDHGQAVKEMAGRIERVARDIWEGRMEPKPGEFCGGCEVRHACPVFVGGQQLLAG